MSVVQQSLPICIESDEAKAETLILVSCDPLVKLLYLLGQLMVIPECLGLLAVFKELINVQAGRPELLWATIYQCV